MKKVSMAIIAALLCIAFVTSCSSTQSAAATKYFEDPDYPYLLITEDGAVMENRKNFDNYVNGKTDLVIPETLCGITVTSIASNGFSFYNAFYSVTLPDTVTSIGSKAFKGSTMTKFTAGSGLKTIGSYAFSGCENLSTVKLNDGLEKISASAFDGCTGLGKVVIPTSVTYIGSTAFAGVTSSSSVVLVSDTGYAADWAGSSDITVKESTKFKVSFQVNGGEEMASIYAVYASEIELPTPTRAGYTFAGWTVEGSSKTYQAGEAYKIPGSNTVLIANWN